MSHLNLEFDFAMRPQPDDFTCGATCLHAVYRYYARKLPLEQVISEVEHLPNGGTLAVFLGLHALALGYEATIYTCDLWTFDPTWFGPTAPSIRDRLLAQMNHKTDPTAAAATQAYIDFLDRGGRLQMEDLSVDLLSRLFTEGTPVIAGLSATWLYRCCRERPTDGQDDDVAGVPAGHFVVLHGLDASRRQIKVADPLLNQLSPQSHLYEASVDRVIGAILLSIVTHDAKLLVLRPRQLPSS